MLLICGEQIGSPASFQEINARVVANDFYFGGDGDEIDGITFAPLGERYLPFDPDTLTLFPDHHTPTEHIVFPGPLLLTGCDTAEHRAPRIVASASCTTPAYTLPPKPVKSSVTRPLS